MASVICDLFSFPFTEIRAIYYWAVAPERILMLLVYAKGDQDDLSKEQLRALRKLVEVEYR